ncbi:hypothetical protein AK830_g3409 [Neonectria ditissima]|uniref:Uncharacterized protein n=1 Tax=Neonectria ditissima TaxID=78410 RepID=A0A0P7BQB4_9HYPO|nr:hypothetical protein AK830_g3409 [Neonectria ditissima]
MASCLCSSISQLARDFNEARAKELVPTLNQHLAAIRAILARSKAVSRDVQYNIMPNNQRAMKVLSVRSVDMAPVDRVCERVKDNLDAFWMPSDDATHVEIHRRVACITIFLRSRLDPESLIPLHLATFVQGQQLSELRYAGKKYIKIARKLGGIGSVFCLPLDVPFSTYERYVNMDDEETFNHLNSVISGVQDYSSIIQRLVSSQLNDATLPVPYHNLFAEYGDVLLDSDQLLLLLHALGGCEVPITLLESVRLPQRRWNSEGEIQRTDAKEFGLPLELCNLLSDKPRLSLAAAHSDITTTLLEDGTPAYSISSESMSALSTSLLPQTSEDLAVMALKFICFACPPCYEGNTTWSPTLKKAVWSLLDKATEQKKIPLSLKSTVIEALLYFAERDSFTIRCLAVERARGLLRKPMPYYLHASVALFQSILCRLDGNLVKSDAKIREFKAKNRDPVTRSDNALRGRVHVSHIENKIQRCDDDVASCIYDWHAERPLSTLEIEVTRRVQSTAAKFFQSTGDFQTARASLEQYLSLNPAEPIRVNTRRLIVGRLADIYCELQEYSKAAQLVQPEFECLEDCEKKSRPVRRLLLALVEYNIGQGRLYDAESTLQELSDAEPLDLEDITDQLLHMRRLLAAARSAHEQLDFDEALRRWRFALQETDQLLTFKFRHGFTTAIIYLSMAHAQLLMGDKEGGRQSWAAAADIFRTERCEYWIPVVATAWLQKIVGAIYDMQGWPFRMMLPGRKPDVTWP